jgi:uncharacterized membrane protein
MDPGILITWLLDPTNWIIKILMFVAVVLAVGHLLKQVNEFIQETKLNDKSFVKTLEYLFMIVAVAVIAHPYLHSGLVGHIEPLETLKTLGLLFITTVASLSIYFVFGKLSGSPENNRDKPLRNRHRAAM